MDPAAEELLLRRLAHGMFATGVATALALTVLKAPYGRYANERWGPRIAAKLGWFVMESPTLVFAAACTYLRVVVEGAALNPNAAVLLTMFAAHYVNRAIVYPLRLRASQEMPAFVAFLAWCFCVFNGYMQARSLCSYSSLPAQVSLTPRFVVGVGLWFAGLIINVHADETLRNLRGPGEAGVYKIPRGGAFEYVTGANFFGEIVEWLGFAIARGDIYGFAFAFYTAANIGPRAMQHHRWYLEKFKEEYPKERRAVIPLLL
mmetsp:Transcript_21062/g.64160  ORF Transcript_21062/g.64160 Transcript_21062/m.64160 type:complete len:261 (-) Transcript_21062:73-855(-)